MTFCGHDISRLKPFEIARLGLGFVPEDRRIFSDLTVMENLDIGRQPPRSSAGRQAGAGLDAGSAVRAVSQSRRHADAARRPHERRRAADADRRAHADGKSRSSCCSTSPPKAWPPSSSSRWSHTIQKLKEQGLSILLSEQNIHFAELVSDRAYVLEKGQIHWQGTMRELADNVDIQRSFLTV